MEHSLGRIQLTDNQASVKCVSVRPVDQANAAIPSAQDVVSLDTLRSHVISMISSISIFDPPILSFYCPFYRNAKIGGVWRHVGGLIASPRVLGAERRLSLYSVSLGAKVAVWRTVGGMRAARAVYQIKLLSHCALSLG